MKERLMLNGFEIVIARSRWLSKRGLDMTFGLLNHRRNDCALSGSKPSGDEAISSLIGE